MQGITEYKNFRIKKGGYKTYGESKNFSNR